MFVELHKAKINSKDNEKYLNMVSYYLAKRDFGTVKELISSVGKFTKDPSMLNRVSGLFFTNPKVKEYFGIAEDIVGSMSNMVFGGEVSLKSHQKNAEKELEKIYLEGEYFSNIIKAYKTAISTNGKAYLFYKTDVIFDTSTNVTTGYEFLGYDVVPEFELKITRNTITRTFVKENFNDLKKEKEYLRFEYKYIKNSDKEYELNIIGYDEQNIQLSDKDVLDILGIDTTYELYNYRPYDVLNLEEGMLPNILWIENSLAENLYFQDEDLPNSQTTKYIPEHELLEGALSQGDLKSSFNDKYNTTKIVKGVSIDPRESIATVVEGKSAISFIERNLALNVVQACLDAKISPISIGYSLTDRLGNNTDVGADKERVSIRLRERHIDKLKIFMVKVLQRILAFRDIHVPLEKLSVAFAQYITPSIESLTKTLAQQVQFGLKSREQAVLELSRGELTPEEVELEMERITKLITQVDYNANLNDKNQKGVEGMDNRIKGED